MIARVATKANTFTLVGSYRIDMHTLSSTRCLAGRLEGSLSSLEKQLAESQEEHMAAEEHNFVLRNDVRVAHTKCEVAEKKELTSQALSCYLVTRVCNCGKIP